MSLNFVLAYLPDTTPEILDAAGGAPLSFDAASSMESPGPAVAASGSDTLLVDPTMLFLDPPHFAQEAGATIVALAGVSDHYVLQVVGERPRLRVYAEGELVEDDGDPIASEYILEDVEDPEDAHLGLFCEVAGIEQEDLFALEWRLLSA